MQVTETLSDGLKRGYTVVVPAADLEGRRAKRLAELGRTVRLPGFRPGKVPPTLVRQRFGQAVHAEVLEASVSEAMQQVIAERHLRSAGQPRVEVVAMPEPREAAPKDLEFKVELEVLPEVVLPDLTTLRLTRRTATPPEETIDRALGELARRQRTLEPVEEQRPAAAGDVLTIDFAGQVDGAAFAGGTGTGMDVEVGGPGFIPGFTEQLAGMTAGEQRRIEVTFPAEYGVKDLAGKAATFDVTAKALKRVVVPPVDEALAEKLGFEGGLAEVRTAIGAQVQREFDQLSRLRLKRDLLDALEAAATFPVPQGMVEAEFGQIWQRVEADRTAGRLDDDDKEKDEATLRAEYRAIAERRVRLGLMLAEIGRAGNVTVGEEEMARAMRAEAMRYPGQEQKVLEFFRKNPQAAESLRAPLFEEKVVDHILRQAQVSDQVVTPEELAADPALPPAIAAAAPAGAVPADGAEAAPVPEAGADTAGRTAGSEG
jgi:trigger factor